jgi:hypothetical protein
MEMIAREIGGKCEQKTNYLLTVLAMLAVNTVPHSTRRLPRRKPCEDCSDGVVLCIRELGLAWMPLRSVAVPILRPHPTGPGRDEESSL